MTMACVAAFLLILFAANKATLISHSSNLDMPLPGSGNDVNATYLPETATSVQYCMIDNCTIRRIDTGEELKIIHTTKHFIVAVPTNNHISETVLMIDEELPCLTVEYNNGSILLAVGVQIALSLAHAFINIYVVTVHLLFAKELSAFSKLLMSHNIVLFFVQIFLVISVITHYVIPLGTQVICQGILNIFMLLTMAFECYSTCILFHTALTMYYSYKSKPEMPKNLYLFYNYFVFGLFMIFAPIIIGYDLYSGNGKQTILASGHCTLYIQYSYQTLRIKDYQHFCNKVAQLSFFAVFLFFYYKRRNTIKDAEHKEASIHVSKKLIRIGIAMGATIGLARVAWIAASVLKFSQWIALIGNLAFLFQQFVVMISLMCSHKTSRLCREQFCTSQDHE